MNEAPKHDYRGSRILDESLYRIVEDYSPAKSSRIIFLLTSPDESLRDTAQPWIDAIRDAPNSSTTCLWVAQTTGAPLVDFDAIFGGTGISYRILEVLDLPAFLRQTALNVAPTALLFEPAGDITAAIVGRGSAPFIASLLAGRGGVSSTVGAASIYRFAGAQRLAHPGFNISVQETALSETEK